jgi:hypothetical protein
VSGSIPRREFLWTAAFAATALQGQQSQPAGLGIRFRTEPALLARMLPPGFSAAEAPQVQVEFAADAAWARILLSVLYGEKEGWLPIALWTSTDRDRFVAREGIGLGATHADIAVSADGGSVAVNGETILELTVGQGGEDALPSNDLPLLFIRFSANEDWTQGEPSGAGDVLELDWPATAKTAIDPSTVQLKWRQPSPSYPASELPVREILSAWKSAQSEPLAAATSDPQAIAKIANSDLAPWAPLRYPRPSVDRTVRRPEGWPDQATALRWTAAESKLWQSRKELRFEPAEIVEVDALISPEVHAQLLPAPCVPGSRPLLKVMGIRFNNVGPEPVNELWLLAFCRIGRTSAWYALSHTVGPGGDLVYGREAFGYPTKSGDPKVVVTPIDCSLTGSRQGREFFYADGGFGGFSTGTSIGRLNILNLRVRPGQRTGELVLQQWAYQGRRQQVNPVTAAMDVPDGDSKLTSVRLDPWYGLRPIQLAAMGALETGGVQRQPGQVVATVAQPNEFYRERCDGVLPWEADSQERPQPSLIVKPGQAAQS